MFSTFVGVSGHDGAVLRFFPAVALASATLAVDFKNMVVQLKLQDQTVSGDVLICLL